MNMHLIPWILVLTMKLFFHFILMIIMITHNLTSSSFGATFFFSFSLAILCWPFNSLGYFGDSFGIEKKVHILSLLIFHLLQLDKFSCSQSLSLDCLDLFFLSSSIRTFLSSFLIFTLCCCCW